MNLKESFRYQKFIDQMIQCASNTLIVREHCLKTTKTHLRNEANPDAENITEIVDNGDFTPNDTVLKFMVFMVEEKNKLSVAIGKAKSLIGFDLDAAVETNKERQFVSQSIKTMLGNAPEKRKTQEYGYKFDVNGAQQRYYYNVELTSVENYDKKAARDTMRAIISEADRISADIDAAIINTSVDYNPPFDVNESFNDVVEMFAETLNNAK